MRFLVSSGSGKLKDISLWDWYFRTLIFSPIFPRCSDQSAEEKERGGLCTGKNSVKADGTCRQRECISVSAFLPVPVNPHLRCLPPVLRHRTELTSEIESKIIVTHEMTFARDISDHIIFMDKGLIAVEGSPKEV